MKQRQFKVYSFGRKNIKEGIITSDSLKDNEITLTDSFLMFALECYKNETLENGQLIEEIIKIMLPNTEEAAKHEWENGLTFNGKQYYAWFATTGGMKKEDLGKCETIFIREDFKVFADEFEDLISLGKFKEIEESNKKICINKDILSRLSLAVSSCYAAGDMPDFIVLPQPQFRIVKDYKTLEKFTKEVDGKALVDYKLVDFHFNDDIDVFDGGAVATPKVFSQIEKALKLNYPAEFAIIRGYGLGIKGMITKFDIIGYLNDTYKHDTEYCRKVNGQFQLLDMWNEWQTVTDNTMLLNESMVKLAKYFENMDEYKQRMSKVDPKYKDMISKLYVTKVNKRDEEIEEYRRTNYQLINALALSKADYFELIKNDVRSYKKILKPFDKASDNDEWIINIDPIRLFFKNIVKGDKEDSEEFQDEVKRITNNVVNKCEELLHISEDFVHLKFVRNNLAKLIEKKCREIACGKFTVKAKYQYIAPCPISYVNFAMNRDQGSNGLNAGEFYSADCNDGDIRTISRNPLCAYSEVHNVTFVRNAELDKWLSSCRELIYFNQKSDILMLMSSADTDGDACTAIDSEIIRNAVVVPRDGKYFINKDDGHKELMEYNAENRFYATYRASGNLIGKISLKAASINCDSQNTPDYYDINQEKFVNGYEYILEIPDKEERRAFFKDKVDKGEWITTYRASEQHREYIKQRFYENEKEIYIVLYNAMVSIDAPKTLYFPSSDDMKIINEKYYKKAWFLQYDKNVNDVNLEEYQYTSGLLNVFSRVIREQLLDEIDNIKSKFDNKAYLIQEKLVNGDYNEPEYLSCVDEISSLYRNYTNERQMAEKLCLSQINKEKKAKKEQMDFSGWSQFEEDEHNATIRRIKAEKYKKYKEIDASYIVSAEVILNKYDLATIANAIGNMKNCTEDFIINLFFPVFAYLNDKLQTNRWVYVKAEDGDIVYLQERYEKIPVKPMDNSNIVKNLHLEEKKRLKVIDVKTDVRARVLASEAIELIQSEFQNSGHLYFDIKVRDNKVILSKDDKDMLEVFKEWMQINQYNLMNCSSIKFELLVDIAESKKSLRLTATEIAI